MATAEAIAPGKETDWSKPAAMAIPKEGYFTVQNGRYGPTYPRTPACYGFTIIAKIKPGSEAVIRQYGNTIEKTIAGLPDALAVLRLHYLRWVLFNIGQIPTSCIKASSTPTSTNTLRTPYLCSQNTA